MKQQTVDALSISPGIARSERGTLTRVLVGSALMFVVLQGGLNLLFPRLDLTWSSLIVTAAW